MTRWRSGPPLLILLLAGCDGDQPQVSSEHLDIVLYDADRVCQGSLDDFEAHTQRVAAVLGVDLGRRILVHLGYSILDELCGSDPLIGALGGCARGFYDEAFAAASFATVYHELVHAVRLIHGVVGTRFFEEGIAMVLAGDTGHPSGVLRPPEGRRGPAELATLPWREFTADDYVVAGHFVAWLYTARREDFLRFIADERYAGATAVEFAFLEHLGLTFVEAEEIWRNTSEEGYRWGDQCESERVLAWDGQALEFTGRVDCDDHDTLGPVLPGQLSARPVCFSTAEPGAYRVDFEAPSGQLTFQSLGCVPTAGLTPEHTQRKAMVAGESEVLPFGRCDWKIVVDLHGYEAATFSLRLTRIEP